MSECDMNDELISFLKEHARLTDWEREFVYSISQRLINRTPLTSKQVHKLKDVADRHAFYGEFRGW